MSLTLPKLRSIIEEMDAPELRVLIEEIFKSTADNKRLLSAKLEGDNSELLNKLYTELLKTFEPKRGTPSLRLAPARKALRDYMKASTPLDALSAQLSYVEAGIRCTNKYGGISEAFCAGLSSVWRESLKHALALAPQDLPWDRLETILKNSDGIGWGFADELHDDYKEFLEKLELKPKINQL